MQNTQRQNEAELQREFFEELRQGGEGMRQAAETDREAAEGAREDRQLEHEGEEVSRTLAEISRNDAESLRRGAEASCHQDFLQMAYELRESLAELRQWAKPSQLSSGLEYEDQSQMQPIINFSTQVVCWLKGKVVLSNDGLPVAFIESGAIFAIENQNYLGQFDAGVFRDRLGCIVASLHGEWWCRDGIQQPHPPRVQAESEPDWNTLVNPPPNIAKPLLSRSTLDWDHFMRGCEPQQPWRTRR